MSDLVDLQEAIERGDRDTAVRLTREAIARDAGAQVILDTMTEAMRVVGSRFQSSEIFVPEMLVSARAMKEAVALLEPVLVQAGVRPIGTAVIGTVKGDLHDIGKNLVEMMWKGANIDVVDLGTNVSPERFADAARQHQARLVGVSALLTTTMTGLRDVAVALQAAELPDTKLIVGGAPVTAEYASEIGADLFASDAGSAVEVALSVMAG